MGSRRIAVLVVVLALGMLLGSPVGATADPPVNDDFASATAVPSLPFQETIETTEATREAGEPDPPCGFLVGRTVWYEFTPGSDSFVSVDTLGSDYDTVVAVWTGSDLASLEPVACSDDTITLGAQVAFRARSATTYYIQAGGFAGEAGSLRFRMRAIEAGLVEGTVTQEGTGTPLEDICVEVLDRDVFSVHTVTTRGDGTYEVVLRPGSYLVLFLDLCDSSDDHIPEWFDGVPFSQTQDATPVDVAVDDVVTGVDAELTQGCPGIASVAALDGFNQVVGTPSSETLLGTAGNDAICGRGGKDTIRGRGGNDVLFGGRGSDRLVGGDGQDTALGGPGRDVVSGGRAGDFLVGNAGNDRLRGGRGDDFMIGGKGRDVCSGGLGADHARGCEVSRSVIRIRSRVIARNQAADVSSWTRGVSRRTLLARVRD